MHPLQAAIIWLLCVALGGVISVGIVLWLHRDPPRHAAPRPPRAERWIDGYVRKVQDMLPGGTPWDADGHLRDAGCPECGLPWAQPSPGCPHLVYDLHKRASPDVDLHETAERTTRNARLVEWYRQREEALTQQLLDAGAAAWH